tara:strand:+ start:3671 stop:4072 length:402 start_codon:yes stop_codon:yes gene_type:complete
MNIKQFLIFKACDVLLPELKYHILKFVQDEAAVCIQRLFTFKIAKNMDIFTKIMRLLNENNHYQWHYVNSYIKYAMYNITYTYIQEPLIWINYLEDLIDIYGYHRYFSINNIHYIINCIKDSNNIYKNTGTEY